jgi:hypothetical protein
MVFDPSILPPGHQRLLTEAGIAYEDSEDPPIAIAPREFDAALATMWVQSHGELMLLRDLDGAWILFFFAANNSVQFEKFQGITGAQRAATKMRDWLDAQGLMLSDPQE